MSGCFKVRVLSRVAVLFASAALAIGRPDAAFAAADRGVRVWPRQAAFLALRGLARAASGRSDEAGHDLAAAVALDPAEPLIGVLRARLKQAAPPDVGQSP